MNGYVLGNRIGTDLAGAVALANAGSGVGIANRASANTIGGINPGEGDVISGNGGNGIDIVGAGTTSNQVVGNMIGTAASGSVAVANGLSGVEVYGGATDDSIGGTVRGSANIIAFNGSNGVQVGDDPADNATGNSIIENSIFSNGMLGIDLNGKTSPSGNAISSDGPNTFQNAPVLSPATASGSATKIAGKLTAAPSTSYLLEFFSNAAGAGQGAFYLDFLNVTTTASGVASFSFTLPYSIASGDTITATATDPNGNTSEFSLPVTSTTLTDVTADLTVDTGGLVYNRSSRQFTKTLTVTNSSGSAITGPIELVLSNLSQKATLANASGTYGGNPYITVLSSGTLAAGQSLSITLVFTDPTLAAITFTSDFLAGPLPPDNNGG